MEGHGFEYHWFQQPAQWVYRNCRHLSVGIYCFPPSWFSAKVRATGANAYATSKDRRANKIIEEKGLNIGFKAITFGTYGAFGTATHKLIATATANTPCPAYSPWVRPTPKQHAYLLFGFTLARANARMLINAASKRSSAKNAVRTSRSRSTRMVAETE